MNTAHHHDLAETTGFPLRVSAVMAARLDLPGVAAQFLPEGRELQVSGEALVDPIGDEVHSPVKGLTHRYPDRVILRATLTCAVHCRFCFRREVVGDAGPLAEAELAAALEYVAARPAIREVILTGGDPLMLSERRIVALLDRIAAIPHVDLIRLHSRVPVVSPERITPALVKAMELRPAVWMVLHVNHADEIGAEAEGALARLVKGGVPVLSQSVLLRGVNDDPEILGALFRKLLMLRVKPYYLHHADLVRGGEHFRTTIAEGQAIMAALRGKISGTALPHYVIDLPGGHGKVPLGPDYLAAGPKGHRIRDPQGVWHDYADPDRGLLRAVKSG
jgi:lysine 2,3-aminomutase